VIRSRGECCEPTVSVLVQDSTQLRGLLDASTARALKLEEMLMDVQQRADGERCVRSCACFATPRLDH
jgi:hypothetical protein